MQNTDPNLVRNAKPSDFDKIPIQDREDCMMLHGPRTVTVKKEQLVFYDIIVHSEKNTAFSLCRFNDKEEARKRFNEYKSHIPIMMAIDRDLCLLVRKPVKFLFWALKVKLVCSEYLQIYSKNCGKQYV